MDASGAALVAQSLGAGVAIGLTTIVAITITLLPASWVMNRFIYHTPLMRVILAVLAGIGSFGTFAIVLIGCATGLLGKPYYFGLLPTFLKMGADDEPVGFFAMFKKLMRAIAHPFQMRYNADPNSSEAKGFMSTIELMLVPAKGEKITVGADSFYNGAVYEPLFEKARKAGAAVDDEAWVRDMNQLSGLAKAVFTGVGDAVPPPPSAGGDAEEEA